MIEIAAFHFLSPGWLLLLPPVWWLSWVYAKRCQRRSMWPRICDPELLQEMHADNPIWTSDRWLRWILGIVLTIGILAAAGPSWRTQSLPLLESVNAQVVALDLSRSMLVEDVKPSRFRHAIAVAREVISSDFDGETGLVVFAGAAFVVSPLSKDANTLLAFLDALDPSTMPEDGTRIDLAIITAQDLLEASIDGSGHILIITAGSGSNQGAAEAALSAAAQGHRVSVVAIGTTTGGPRLDLDGKLARDPQGRFELSKTNLVLLERIARLGKGSIATLAKSSGQGGLLISRLGANQLLESDQAGDSAETEAVNDGAWLILLMLPLALLLFRKNLFWIILLGVMLPNERELYAKEWDSFWNHVEKIAFEAYQSGDYQTAYERSSNPLLQGAAYYRHGQYGFALERFAADDSAQSIYNLGNTLAQQQLFPEAIVAYQKALAIKPDLKSARHNKRLIELFLEQQLTAGSDQATEPAAEESLNDDLDPFNAETSIGIASQYQVNPADDQQLGPGLGASTQSSQVDPFEQFDGLEQEMERFMSRAVSGEQLPKLEIIERWISSLPETSTDLFRRKFLRDFQRQKRQSR